MPANFLFIFKNGNRAAMCFLAPMIMLWNCVPNTYNSHMLLHMNVILFLPCLIILLVITFGSYSYGWNSAPVYF